MSVDLASMDSNPSDEVLLLRDDLDNSELLERGALFSAKYLNTRAMIRFGRPTINTVSLKKQFDSLFPGHLNDWIEGLMWASGNWNKSSFVRSPVKESDFSVELVDSKEALISKELLLSKNDLDDSELLKRGAVFSAKYLNLMTMIRLGHTDIYNNSLRKKFDSLFPNCSWNWDRGLSLALADFDRAYLIICTAKREQFVKDVIGEIRKGINLTDQRMIDAVFASIGFDV